MASSVDSLPKPNLIDSLHFSFAGIMTCVYLAAEVVGRLVSNYWHLTVEDWILFGAAAAAVLFSGIWSVRMIGQEKRVAWVFVIGDCIYALVIALLCAHMVAL